MATTTNYGWTTPDDTALVKDGAAAIRSLGTAIDTSMNTALGTKKAGLVLLNTTSFSAVASQSISSVFTSSYENYLIVINWVGSNSNQLYMRVRSGTTDESGANYKYSGFTSISNSATLTGVNNDSNTVWRVGFATSTIETSYSTVTLWSPQNANRRTEYQANYSWYDNTRFNAGWASGGHLNIASYDGFTIFQDGATPTITGSVSTYGFNK